MRPTRLIPLALLLAACGDTSPVDTVDDSAVADMDMDSDLTLDAGGLDAGGPDAGDVPDTITTRGEGIVMTLAPEDGFITLDHKPIPDIQMGAMRMPFDVDPDLNLSRYAKNDRVLFALDVSTDTGLLITKLCRPSTDGEDCLD